MSCHTEQMLGLSRNLTDTMPARSQPKRHTKRLLRSEQQRSVWRHMDLKDDILTVTVAVALAATVQVDAASSRV